MKPMDDQDAQRLNDLKTMRVRSEGYEVPKDQEDVHTRDVDELDIAYHNRYGAEEETTGPLGSNGFTSARGNKNEGEQDMGYHNRFFRD